MMRRLSSCAAVLLVFASIACSPEGAGSTAEAEENPTSIVEPMPSEEPLPPTDRAPNVTGFALKRALNRWRSLEVSVTIDVVKKYSHEEPGIVLRQRPRARAELVGEATVRLIVAKPFPHVPNTVGRNARRAKQTLLAKGYKVRVIMEQTTSARDETVLSQSPAGGTELLPGQTVTLVVANNICTPGYSPCLPAASDYDCAGGEGDGPKYVYGTVRVSGYDPYDLDRDNDGYGCDP